MEIAIQGTALMVATTVIGFAVAALVTVAVDVVIAVYEALLRLIR